MNEESDFDKIERMQKIVRVIGDIREKMGDYLMFLFAWIGRLIYGPEYDSYERRINRRPLPENAADKKKARHIDGPFSLLYVWEKSHLLREQK